MVGVVTGDRMLGCNQLMLIPGDCQFVIRGPGSDPVEGGAQHTMGLNTKHVNIYRWR